MIMSGFSGPNVMDGLFVFKRGVTRHPLGFSTSKLKNSDFLKAGNKICNCTELTREQMIFKDTDSAKISKNSKCVFFF